jgi:hypothetical protein
MSDMCVGHRATSQFRVRRDADSADEPGVVPSSWYAYARWVRRSLDLRTTLLIP